ncbi:MAG: hypothetical protein KKE51_05810 [Gammaproteobacteria bacterium]|nr:hypothetical protein [Gammaproteobacteria bacterium]MBU2435740.1 hypothetical protein [Gammaproteobacteria bacterium]MBU2449479.1 hypothetical protein [Gammaproteobacteria bacterium]
MTEQANPNDRGVTILLEALTTISYLKRGDGRAAAIAEYALDGYETAMRNVNTGRRIDRRSVNGGSPAGLAERRLGRDRRINPDRRCDLARYGE